MNRKYFFNFFTCHMIVLTVLLVRCTEHSCAPPRAPASSPTPATIMEPSSWLATPSFPWVQPESIHLKPLSQTSCFLLWARSLMVAYPQECTGTHFCNLKMWRNQCSLVTATFDKGGLGAVELFPLTFKRIFGVFSEHL